MVMPAMRMPPASKGDACGCSRASRAKLNVVAVDDVMPPAMAVTAIPV